MLNKPRWAPKSNFVPFSHHQTLFGGSSLTTHSKFSLPLSVTRVIGGDKIWTVGFGNGFAILMSSWFSGKLDVDGEADLIFFTKTEVKWSHFCFSARFMEMFLGWI